VHDKIVGLTNRKPVKFTSDGRDVILLLVFLVSAVTRGAAFKQLLQQAVIYTVRRELHWLPIRKRIVCKLAVMVYSCDGLA